MGRRSTSTTKSGKYMNPTDQARKKARQKELKKNKIQRQMIRATVLKEKDPMQIIEEMEKIDQMEYNVLEPSPLNEQVLKDKRKKLSDTLDRLLKMYNKDDPEKWIELKRSQADYEQRRNQLVAFYESVKRAESVSVDDIPLPAIPKRAPTQISLPVDSSLQPTPNTSNTSATLSTNTNVSSASKSSILKPNTAYTLAKEPPGVPPGPPPDLSSCSEDDEEEVRSKTVHDINIYTNEPRANTLRFSDVTVTQVLGAQNEKNFENDGQKHVHSLGTDVKEKFHMPPSTIVPFSLPPPPPPMPRGVMPFMAPRLPPPSGRPNLPPGPPSGLPPRFSMQLPPAPPPLIPPRMLQLPMMPPATVTSANMATNHNVQRAGAQLINSNDGIQRATIMAKPQIRNLNADVTRFVPSALRVKREDKKSKNVTRQRRVNNLKQQEMLNRSTNSGTKDDAYKQFMREMEGLL